MKQCCLILFLMMTVATGGQQAPSPPEASPSFRIAGVVVSAVTGQPLPRAEVEIGKPQEPNKTASMMTGSDGRFSFAGLARGKYWLVAQRRGFPHQAYQEHEQFSTAIAVGPNLESENLVFRVRPHASISGTITDEAGEAVRDARVMLFYSGVETGRRHIMMRDQAVTDDRGMYHFNNVTPGTYFIAVSATPWYAQNQNLGLNTVYMETSGRHATIFRGRPESNTEMPKLNPALDVAYPLTYYSGATDSSEATPIVIKMGDRVIADLSLTPLPAAHVRVSLPEVEATEKEPTGGVNQVNQFARPSQNIMLMQRVFGEFETPVFVQQVQVAPGEVELSGIPAGRFDMKVQTFGDTPSMREEQVDITRDAELTAGSNASVPLAISGTVTLNGGPLPKSAYIGLRRDDGGQMLQTRVSDKGEFEIKQEESHPGKYEVMVFGIPGAVVRNVNVSGAKVVGQSVEIPSGGTIRLNVDLASGLGEISGTALREGKPVSGAMIILVPQDYENNAGLIRRDQSDSDGTFTLYRVLPGKYTVLALENAWDWEWLNPSVLSPYLAGGTPVEVAARQKYEIKVKAE